MARICQSGTYLLTPERILQQLGTLLVIAHNGEPVVCVGLLDSKVGSDPVVGVVDILGVGGQIRDLLGFFAGHAFRFLGHVGEYLRRHCSNLKAVSGRLGEYIYRCSDR
jgi:hypothetical protein